MNRFKSAQSRLLTFRRNVVFRASNGREYVPSQLAAAAEFGYLNGRLEAFSVPVQNLLLRNVAEFNQIENREKRDRLLAVLCHLPPLDNSDHLVRVARATITNGNSPKTVPKPLTDSRTKFGISLKQPASSENFFFRNIFVDEELDLLRFVIKYGNEKSHNIYQLMKDAVTNSQDYTHQEVRDIVSDWIEYQFKIDDIARLKEIVALVPDDPFLTKKVYFALRDFFDTVLLDGQSHDWYDDLSQNCDMAIFEAMFEAIDRAEVSMDVWRNALLHLKASPIFDSKSDLYWMAKLLTRDPSPNRNKMLNEMFIADLGMGSVRDHEMIKHVIERTSLEAQENALKHYNPPEFTDEVSKLALGHLTGAEYNHFKSCPIAIHYFEQHFEESVDDVLNFIQSQTGVPKASLDRSLDHISSRVFTIGSTEEMIEMIKSRLADSGQNRKILIGLLNSNAWKKVLEEAVMDINPLELWYHGLTPDVFTNLNVKKFKYEMIPLINPELTPNIISALSVADEEQEGSGVFQKFDINDPWHAMVRELTIKEMAEDDDLLMNFVDYEGSPDKIDFTIRFDMARTFQRRIRQPKFLRHFNEEDNHWSNVRTKRIFIHELQERILTTTNKDLRRRYEIIFAKVYRDHIKGTLELIPTLESPLRRQNELFHVYDKYEGTG